MALPGSQNAPLALSLPPFSLFKARATPSPLQRPLLAVWRRGNGSVSLLRAFTPRLCACTSGIKRASPFRGSTLAGAEVRDYVSVTCARSLERRIACTRSVSSLTSVHVRQLCCSSCGDAASLQMRTQTSIAVHTGWSYCPVLYLAAIVSPIVAERGESIFTLVLGKAL